MIQQVLHHDQLLVAGVSGRTMREFESHLLGVARIASGAKPLNDFFGAGAFFQHLEYALAISIHASGCTRIQ